MAQGQKLEGKVVDAVTNKPIPYASVSLLNTSIGTTCNAEGEFVLQKVPVSSKLLVSELGHRRDTIVVTSAAVLRISLTPASVVLPEIHVGSYLADLLLQAYNKSRQLYSQKTYGRAFYRQITRHNGDATEVLEMIWNTKTNNAGVEGTSLAQGRYAEKKALVKLNNFSLNTRLYGVYDAQADTSRSIWMIGPNVERYYSLNLVGVTENGTQQLVEVEFASKPGINPNHHRGSITIDAITHQILRFQMETEGVRISSNSASTQFKDQRTFFEMVFQASEKGAPILNYVSVRYQAVIARPKKDDVNLQVNSLTVFYDGQPVPSGIAYSSAVDKANKSDLVSIKRTTYNPTFWAENSIVKRTPLEEGVIQAFEQKGAFGTLLTH
ncbi:hypothetical protein GCM10023185_18690 [Hymenobacter saemangeumensis]|uniref:Carboxypeptidase-like regulatory domain-containing protein n=1 Tax=Hymenobacter saemangeumensis TaxID=1084522 RepID=A0ABP8IBU5_9BACT